MTITRQAPLRRDPDFRRFFSARMVSLAGSALTYIALPVLIYSLSHSPLLTGVVSGFEAVPYLLLGLVAGAIADRWDRRRLMVAADIGSGLALASLPLAAAFGVLTVGQVLTVAILGPTLFVFFDAANFGAVPSLVGRDRIASANSALWGAGTVVETFVPAAAGALLAVAAATTLIGFDAVSFLASALLIRGVARPLSDPGRDRERLRLDSLAADVREGVRFLLDHTHIRTITLVSACQSIAGGAFVGQLVVWADREFGIRGGNPRLGVLYGAWGVGSLVAAVPMPRLVRSLGAARVTLIAMPVSASLAVATALAPTWIFGAALVIAWGAAYMLVVISSVTYRQQVTPERLMSRVNAAGRMLSFGVGWPLGALLGGIVAESAGPVAGMLAGAAFASVGAVLAWLSPLRSARVSAEPRTGAGAG